jgi:hypothetical protein
VLTVVLEVTVKVIGVFCEVRTEYSKLATKHSVAIPEPFWLYLRAREIPARLMIAEKSGRFPEVHTFNNI